MLSFNQECFYFNFIKVYLVFIDKKQRCKMGLENECNMMHIWIIIFLDVANKSNLGMNNQHCIVYTLDRHENVCVSEAY